MLGLGPAKATRIDGKVWSAIGRPKRRRPCVARGSARRALPFNALIEYIEWPI
jgi:hypothetical protein